MVARLLIRGLNGLPSILRVPLSPMYNVAISNKLFRKLLANVVSLQCCQDYWRNPDAVDSPERYLDGKEQSEYLVSLIGKYADKESRILEVGCNVGRNLNQLHSCGYRNLEGVEISDKAVELMRMSYPMLAECRIYNVPVEDIINVMPDKAYDVVFTLEVLKHIHRDSEWVFGHIARITKGTLITVEGERGMSWCIFPRNYKEIFERFGMRQVEENDCSKVPKLSVASARVFRRIDGHAAIS